MKNALMLVDVQNLYVTTNDRTMKNIFNAVSAMRADSEIVWVFMNPGEQSEQTRISPWSRKVLSATLGNSMSPAITPADGDILTLKGRPSAFSNRGLADYLRAQDIGSLQIAGFFACACVRETAIDAVKNGFETVVRSDLIADKEDRIWPHSLKNLRHQGVRID